jgi:hypothetical protein
METFRGPWLIEVLRRTEVDHQQAFTITGSDGSDGRHPGTVGDTVAVAGAEWQIELEWQDHGLQWHTSRTRRTGTTDVRRGLLITVGASNFDAPAAPFDHLVLLCQSLDPEIDDGLPPDDPYDFTYPESWRVR